MSNPLKDPKRNPLKPMYESFWVPIFGRALRIFSAMIEGEEILEKQTYDLREDKNK